VDPVGGETSARTVSEGTGAERVVGIRLFTSHPGHGEIGVPGACRLPVARRGFPGIPPGQRGKRRRGKDGAGRIGRRIRTAAGGEPDAAFERRGRRFETHGTAPGVGNGHPRGDDPPVGGARPDAHGPG